MDEKTAKPVDLSSAADVSAGRKRKADQSCFERVTSIREDPHGIPQVGKRPNPVAAPRSLCLRHCKPMVFFCRRDQQCICNLCLSNAHKSHDVVLIEKEVPEKKIKLKKMQTQTTKMIQTRENEEQALKQAIHSFKTSAVQAVKGSDKSFTELIHSIERKQRALKELIMAQEEAVLKQGNTLLERLEQEISDLKSIDAKLRLEAASSIPHLPKSIQLPALLVHPSRPFQLTINDVSNLNKQLHSICQWRFMTISERVRNTGIVSTPLPQTYQELLKYAVKLTLDTNTVHDLLKLSNQDTELTAVEKPECRPSHPDRFERRIQALCREGLRGAPRYWEVECGMKGSWVTIAVSYKGMTRKGKKAPLFGRCKNSWAFRHYGDIYEFWHGDKCEKSHKDSSLEYSRMGIYLDHGAGVLAFYNVSGKGFSLIFKIQTQFKEPVYAGFGLVGVGSRIRLCDL